MFKFITSFIFFFLLIEFNNNFINYEFNNINNSYFILFYVFILLLSNLTFNTTQNHRLDLDLLFKFLLLFIKTPSFLLNYIINILKKIFIYLLFFKYRYFFNTIKISFKKYSKSVFLIWRPLFKKTSYFGYYRSNRSKWIK